MRLLVSDGFAFSPRVSAGGGVMRNGFTAEIEG